MAGVISIVLKAVDQYSGVLTGLNQGFELVTKGLNFVKGAADTAFSAINAGAQLAAKGGAYVEMRQQFNNVANAYGQDGAKIIKIVDDVSLGTVKMADAAKIAGKGITAGLDAKQIESVLTFVKRRTELTGESFQSMSETVINAFATGRTSALGRLGIFAEKADSTADLVRKLEEATKNYGGTTFNTADALASLSTQADKFWTALGAAVNQSETFQKVLGFVVNTVRDLVESFDPRPITVFIDTVFKLFEALLASARIAAPAIFESFDGAFQGLAQGTFGLVETIGKGFFNITKIAANTVNNIFDILTNSGLVTVVEVIVGGFVSAFTFGAARIIELVGGLVSYIITGFSEIVGLAGDIARDFPLLSEKIGIDPVKLAQLEVDLKKAARGVGDFANATAELTEKAGDFGVELTTNIADTVRNFRISPDMLDGLEQGFLDGLNKINQEISWGDDLGASVAKGLFNEANQLDRKFDAERTQRAEKSSQRAADDARKRQADLLKALDSSIKLSEFAIPMQIDAKDWLNLSQFQQVELRQEQQRQEKLIKDRLGFEFDLRQRELENKARLIQKIDPLARLAELAQSINWPAETEALFRFMLMWLATMAGQEEVPLAITVAG